MTFNKIETESIEQPEKFWKNPPKTDAQYYRWK